MNESGLYALIFGSKMESAARFKKVVSSEVLPAIRKTGSYQAKPAFQIPSTLADALQLAADQSRQIEQLAGQAERMRPKIEAHDRIAESFGSVCRKIAAKNLNVPPQVLNRWMVTNGWTYKHANGDTLAYQSKISAGYLEHKINTGPRADGTMWTRTNVHVTPKGMLALAKAFHAAAKIL